MIEVVAVRIVVVVIAVRVVIVVEVVVDTGVVKSEEERIVIAVNCQRAVEIVTFCRKSCWCR